MITFHPCNTPSLNFHLFLFLHSKLQQDAARAKHATPLLHSPPPLSSSSSHKSTQQKALWKMLTKTEQQQWKVGLSHKSAVRSQTEKAATSSPWTRKCSQLLATTFPIGLLDLPTLDPKNYILDNAETAWIKLLHLTSTSPNNQWLNRVLLKKGKSKMQQFKPNNPWLYSKQSLTCRQCFTWRTVMKPNVHVHVPTLMQNHPHCQYVYSSSIHTDSFELHCGRTQCRSQLTPYWKRQAPALRADSGEKCRYSWPKSLSNTHHTTRYRLLARVAHKTPNTTGQRMLPP